MVSVCFRPTSRELLQTARRGGVSFGIDIDRYRGDMIQTYKMGFSHSKISALGNNFEKKRKKKLKIILI